MTISIVTTPTNSTGELKQQTLYEDAISRYGAALERLVRSCEADANAREDLAQEIHLALWRSFATFDGRCSLRTWVYRVAHNAAATHIERDRRHRSRHLLSLDAIDTRINEASAPGDDPRQLLFDELSALVQQLKPLDRQITVLYLEGLDAVSIADVTGMSSGNVATKIHRIKKILAAKARQGTRNDL